MGPSAKKKILKNTYAKIMNIEHTVNAIPLPFVYVLILLRIIFLKFSIQYD